MSLHISNRGERRKTRSQTYQTYGGEKQISFDDVSIANEPLQIYNTFALIYLSEEREGKRDTRHIRRVERKHRILSMTNLLHMTSYISIIHQSSRIYNT